MRNIIGISGSLRKGSFNTKLLKLAKQESKDTIELVTLDGIPVYNGDVEDSIGIPDAVIRLQNKIKAADGVIISTPEYNNGVPGVLKNAIDWLSRPSSMINEVYAGKAFAMMGVSVGGFGTTNAQTNLLPVLRFLRVSLWCGSTPFLVSNAHSAFTEKGSFSDKEKLERLKIFLDGFSNFIQ